MIDIDARGGHSEPPGLVLKKRRPAKIEWRDGLQVITPIKMPQYYANDNLQCWFRACIDEHYGSLESDADRLYYIHSLSSMEGLREFCDETVELIVDKRGNKSFVEALMNSVDWDALFNDMTNDMEEEKKALLDEKVCMKCNTEHEGNWCPEAEESDE